jgi:phage gpG-like protein
VSLIFGFEFKGLAAMLASLDGAANRITDELERKVLKLSIELEGQAQRHIVGSRATNPPEVLGVDTGRLRQSMGHEVKRNGHTVIGRVGPQRVVYGAVHELGSAAIGHPEMNIPERPYLAPALKELREHIVEEIGTAFSAQVVFGNPTS